MLSHRRATVNIHEDQQNNGAYIVDDLLNINLQTFKPATESTGIFEDYASRDEARSIISQEIATGKIGQRTVYYCPLGSYLSVSTDETNTKCAVRNVSVSKSIPSCDQWCTEINVNQAQKLNFELESTYNVLQSLTNDCHINLHIRWTGCSTFLSRPGDSSQVVLDASLGSRSGPYESFDCTTNLASQLDKLVALSANNLAESGLIVSSNDKIRSFILAMRENENYSHQITSVDTPFKIPVRNDLDFLDNIWLLMYSMDTSEVVIDSLTEIVEELEQGRLLPMINKNNISSASNVIRACLVLSKQTTVADYNQRAEALSDAFDFWIREPTLFLLEIGIWKMRADYIFIFNSLNFSYCKDLEFFLDLTLELKEQIKRLLCLQRIIEMTGLIQSNISNFPTETMRLIVSNLLKFYTRQINNSEDVNQQIRMRVGLPRYSPSTNALIGSFSKNFEPQYWSSTNKFDNGDFRQISFRKNGLDDHAKWIVSETWEYIV